MISLRLPEINAPNAEGQLRQIRSYLYQLTEQLNLAMDSVDTEIVQQKQAITTASAAAETPEGKLKTFDSIKALIIKSADIISAYSEEITQQLSSVYVAESEYGTFKQETTKTINDTADAMTTLIETVQSIGEEQNATKGYIRSGILDDSVTPVVIGVEVGQTNESNGVQTFNAFARFTAEKLSFYDSNGSEVAYISNSKLYIKNAKITGDLTLGDFEIRTTHGFAIKWVGG
jgi:hypothetical protein